MSDPIKKILMQLDKEMAEAVAAGSGKGLGNYDNAIKQIRQQIGRELLELFMERAMWGNRGIEIVINEICQLEEE